MTVRDILLYNILYYNKLYYNISYYNIFYGVFGMNALNFDERPMNTFIKKALEHVPFFNERD